MLTAPGYSGQRTLFPISMLGDDRGMPTAQEELERLNPAGTVRAPAVLAASDRPVSIGVELLRYRFGSTLAVRRLEGTQKIF